MNYCEKCNRVNLNWGYIGLLGYTIVMLCIGKMLFDLLNIDNTFIILIFSLIGIILWGIWIIIYNWTKKQHKNKIDLGVIR